MKSQKWQLFIPFIILLLLILVPVFWHSPRYLSLFNLLFLNIILALGVFSLWSVGMINAAQPVFFGLGAYTVAILLVRVHMPYWLAFPIAGIIPAAIAGAFGFVALKMKGAYFLFLTIALCELIGWIWVAWKGLFRGSVGFYPIPQPEIKIFGLKVLFSQSLVPYYYLALILAVITCLFYFKIHQSRIGRVWESVGKHEDLLANTGVSVFAQKEICFVASCFFAGLAGAVYAPYMTIVSPTQFTLWQGIWIVLGVLVGGIFSPIGAIVGTVFMAVLGVFLTRFSNTQPLILGVILVFVLLFMPSGLFGVPGRVINKIRDMAPNHNIEKEESGKRF
jgi:branched-chain amino acid transport system permease protein